MTRKINPKALGFDKKSITIKAGSYINKKGELVKTRDYSSMYDPEQMTRMDELSLYNGKIDLDEERKRGRSKPKAKKRKSKKRK